VIVIVTILQYPTNQ